MKHLPKSTLILIVSFITLNVNAQKLPNVQSTGVRIPANSKMDGKTTEWDGKFQAYNTATNLYYTMANNAEFVYLIAHIKDPSVIKRITDFGFTFEIYQNETLRNKDMVSVTLPYAANKYFSLNLSKPTGADPSLEKDILKENNSLLSKNHKYTLVKGVQGLDSVAIYNDKGIAFVEAFDSNEDYTMELQLPVKFIKFLSGNESKFSYRLVINARPNFGPVRQIISLGAGGSATFTEAKDFTPEQKAMNEEISAMNAIKYAATDFKAEYTLVKE